MMTRVARMLISPAIGRRALQPAFERLHRLALVGMNMGWPADDPRRSGEALVLRGLPSGATILDVGAHRGVYSAIALALVPSARIHAFEPNPEALTEFRRRIGDGAQLHEHGLGDTDGDLEFYVSAADSGLASTVRRTHPGMSWAPAGSVAVRQLDGVCGELGVEHVDLLKIDVEGAELAVLRGAKRMLAEHRIDRIQFEFGGTAVDARVFLRDIVAELSGFTLHRIVRDGVVPLVYAERWEIFTTTNFLAVRLGAE